VTDSTTTLSAADHAALVRARQTLTAWRAAGSKLPLTPRQLVAWETIVALDGLSVARNGNWWTDNGPVACGAQCKSVAA
jgi:hypothetical protein